MSWGLVVVGGAALAGSMISADASRSAAQSQADAANNASNVMLNQNNMSRQDMAPWLSSGQNALGQLNQQMPDLTRNFSLADFRQDPGYQFNLQQGQQAIERSAAARGGGIGGGATTASLMDYSQGLAGQQYQNAFNNFNTNQTNRFNRLASMSNVGQQAATQNSQNGMATAAGVGQNIIGAGNANAAGQIGQANAINNGIGSVTNTWMQQQMLNRLAPQVQQPGVWNGASQNQMMMGTGGSNSPGYGG